MCCDLYLHRTRDDAHSKNLFLSLDMAACTIIRMSGMTKMSG